MLLRPVADPLIWQCRCPGNKLNDGDDDDDDDDYDDDDDDNYWYNDNE